MLGRSFLLLFVALAASAQALPTKKQYISESYTQDKLGNQRISIRAHQQQMHIVDGNYEITPRDVVDFSVNHNYQRQDNGSGRSFSFNLQCHQNKLGGISLEDYRATAWYSNYGGTTYYYSKSPTEISRTQQLDYLGKDKTIYLIFDKQHELALSPEALYQDSQTYQQVISHMQRYNQLQVRIYDEAKQQYEIFSDQWDLSLKGFSKYYAHYLAACKQPFELVPAN